MIGRNPRYELDTMIVEIIEKKYPQSLRYKELEKKVNVRCQDLGLKKPSTATLCNRLAILCGRKSQYSLFINRRVLHRELRENRGTHYSFTEEFKHSMDIQKKHHPKNYVEKTLSLLQFSGYRDSFDSEADSEK